MAKKCPPGIVCVENNTMYVILAFLIFGIAVVYVAMNYTRNPRDADATNSHFFRFPSPFNLDFIPKFGSGITYAHDMLNNPYVPPLKNDNIFTSPDLTMAMASGGVVPINTSTRFHDTTYRQVGFLSPQGGTGGVGNTLKDNLIPLMGRPLDRSRDKWNFYTINNGNVGLKLPIVNKGRSCTNEYGCDNLYNGDTVYVEGLKQPFSVTMYDNDTMRYLPFL